MLQIGVVGVNYKTASLKLRESLAREAQLQTTKLEQNFDFPHVVLATCNRFEIYFSSNDLYSTSHQIVRTLEKIVGNSSRSSFYHYFDHTCFFHLAKVISGLDSAILGESDIQRQVKKGYQLAHKRQNLSKELHYLFQKSLRIGKKLRTHFLRPHRLINLEKYIATSSKQFIDEPILFVGYSDINRKIMNEFRQNGFSDFTLCTRSKQIDENIPILPFEQIAQWINYSVVVVGTKYGEYLLKEKQAYLESVKTSLIFDLGIPRNVEPLLSEVEKIELIDLEHIALQIEKRREISQLEIKRAEEEIRNLTRQYEDIYQAREVTKMRMLVGV